MEANNQNKELSSESADLGYRIAMRTAVVAGVFTAVVSALLLVDYNRRQAKDPLEDDQYKALKAELARLPQDEGLKDRIRALDLRLREEYFRRRRFAAAGTWLLLGGIAVLLVAAKSASAIRRKLPMPESQEIHQDTETRAMRVARWAVGIVVVVLAGTTIALNVGFRSPLPRDAGQLAALPRPDTTGRQGPAVVPGSSATIGETQLAGPPVPPDKPYYPSAQEIRAGWLRFRGPGGGGVSQFENVPESWDATSGEGIVWKAPVPLPGNNSPVVVGEFVFLSGADAERREVLAFDAHTGALRWRRAVPGTPESTAEPPEVSDDTGYAAPTTTTNGRWVFAMFANGDVASYDFGGNLVWVRSLGMPDNCYGHASSPILYDNLLLIQFDQGGSAKDQKSKLLALDAATGETVYEVPRPVPNSWPTPIVIDYAGRHQLITCADPWVIAYDPANGSEIWRADCLSADCGPSPVFADGVVHVGNEYCQWSAIRVDGKGDVTESHVAWTGEDGLPDMCSPLVTSEYLFLLASWGSLTCYDSHSGELLWFKDFDASFVSSPGWAKGRVYLFGGEGKGWVVQPSREEEKVKVVAETDLGEECVTSPAFQDGRIYIRGKEHLFCIGE